MSELEFTKSDVEFKVGDNDVKFSIIHNMPESFGLSFNNALDSWIVRTDDYSDESLVNYIKQKDTGCIAMTESEYDNLI